MAVIQPPPTYAEVVLVDQRTKVGTFNPIWLKWFVDLAGIIDVISLATGTVTSVGASGGTTGLTFAGSPVTTTGTFVLGGVLVPANGGTGTASFGQIVSSSIVSGSAITPTNNVAVNITSIALTAGDWDVHGNFSITAIGTAPVTAIGWISTTSATVPDQSLYAGIQGTTPEYFVTEAYAGAGTAIGVGTGFAVPYRRLSLGGATTVYLSTLCSNSSGNSAACGNIFPRRMG